jgi:alkylresorcinol/alkylpyrone synthase
MTIAAAASAFPKYRYQQDQLLKEFSRYWGPKLDNPVFLKRLHERVGVDCRYLVLPLEEYEKITTWGQANDYWIQAAQELGQQAICRALARTGFSAADLGALFFVSVTGISSPSIDARLINRMHLSPHIKRVPIFGLGCVAGAAGIARAADYVRAYPKQVAAVLAVEICSLTFQGDDLSVANLISSGLFGDGAAAVLVAGSEAESSGPEILATRSVFYPDTEGVMGWSISEKGFRIVLSPDVPEVVKHHLGQDVDAFLEEEGLTRAGIGSWVLHTGGPKVLDATAAALQLPSGALDASWHCLRNMGNLSSASVLTVLEEVMTNRSPPAGTYGLLAAMGPGFCSELVLLKW